MPASFTSATICPERGAGGNLMLSVAASSSSTSMRSMRLELFDARLHLIRLGGLVAELLDELFGLLDHPLLVLVGAPSAAHAARRAARRTSSRAPCSRRSCRSDSSTRACGDVVQKGAVVRNDAARRRCSFSDTPPATGSTRCRGGWSARRAGRSRGVAAAVWPARCACASRPRTRAWRGRNPTA